MKTGVIILLFLSTVLLAWKKDASRGDYWLKKCTGDDSCGYVDRNGKWKITPGKYLMCFTDTFRKMAVVLTSQNQFIGINRKDERLFHVVEFDNGPDYIVEGLFRICDNGKMGFADEDGNIVIPETFWFVRPFSDERAAFNEGGHLVWDAYHEHSSIAGGKWGFIDREGAKIIPAAYDSVDDFIDGKTSVQRGDSTFFIGKAGQRLPGDQ